jgi:hypothetical protein
MFDESTRKSSIRNIGSSEPYGLGREASPPTFPPTLMQRRKFHLQCILTESKSVDISEHGADCQPTTGGNDWAG